MLLRLCFLLTGCVCRGSAATRHLLLEGVSMVTVPRGAVATLRCPHGAGGGVTWSRLSAAGQKVTLVSVENGSETRAERRYGSLADGSLVITGATPADVTMYLCNGRKTAYLEVTTDGGGTAAPDAGRRPATPGDAGLGSGQAAVATASWKVPVGVVVGAAASVLVAAVTLRLCRRRRAADGRAGEDKAATYEGIYEEIRAGEPAVESPYCWTGVSETPGGSAAAGGGLYSSDAVYYLVQNPPRTLETFPR